MRIGAEMLLNKYKNRMLIAKLMIKGELINDEYDFAGDIISPLLLQAAKYNLDLNKEK